MDNERILVVGGFGVGNYGDEAILSGLINELPRNSKVLVVSQNPKETSNLHNVSSISPGNSIAYLLKSERVIIAGGGLYGGYMGNKGKLLPLFSVLASLVGKNVEYRGLGIHPSTPKLLLPTIKTSIMTAEKVSVRDLLSKKMLIGMGIDDFSVRSDLAFSMNPASRKRAVSILENERVDLSKNLVGVSITRANKKMISKVTPFVRDYLRKNSRNSEVIMIPMFRHKKNMIYDDLLYSQEVAEGFPNVKFLRGNYHPSEILSIFGLLNNSICMRFHSMIFSYRMGVKMLPIPYAEKCSEFLSSIRVRPLNL